MPMDTVKPQNEMDDLLLPWLSSFLLESWVVPLLPTIPFLSWLMAIVIQLGISIMTSLRTLPWVWESFSWSLVSFYVDQSSRTWKESSKKCSLLSFSASLFHLDLWFRDFREEWMLFMDSASFHNGHLCFSWQFWQHSSFVSSFSLLQARHCKFFMI